MRRVLVLAAAAALSAIPAAGGAAKVDYAAVALNVLPPGQSGDLLFPPTAKDQPRLYDGLTPRGGNVKSSDLTRYFKSERFGVTGKVVRTERPRAGVRSPRRTRRRHAYARSSRASTLSVFARPRAAARTAFASASTTRSTNGSKIRAIPSALLVASSTT